MAKYGELIDATTVRFERLLPGPIERVWAHLVESEKRALWLCAGKTELQVGGHVEMLFHNASLSSQTDTDPPEKYKELPERMAYSGKVTRCDPPHVLAHTWEDDDGESEVCYELSDKRDKVLLVLTHTRLKPRSKITGVCGGWHTHLDILIDRLEGNEPQPFWRAHTHLEAEYERMLNQ